MKLYNLSFSLNSSLVLTIIIFYFLIPFTGNAQEEQKMGFNRIELPPSPEASSLGTYGTFPVSLSSGTVNITIPITTVTAGNIVMPVSLSYNTSGIRVQQEASSVGLGWSINAGGVITRTVHGKADEKFGYLSNHSKVPSTSAIDIGFYDPNKIAETYAFVDRNVRGLSDYEPDMFNFNFGNYSGTFYISQNGEPELFPSTDLKIHPLIENHEIKSFTVTDNSGIMYFFGQFGDDSNNAAYEESVIESFQGGDGIPGPLPYRSAWYLVKIIDVITGNEISINYSRYSDYSNGVSYENSVTYSSSETWERTGVNSNFHVTQPEEINEIVTQTDMLFPNEVIWNNNKLDFYHSSTIDGGTLKLDSIVQTNTIDNGIVKTVFGYFPYNSDDNNDFRLKLQSVTFIDDENAGSNKKKYSFIYNNINLPSKDSKSIDHWGYYNGASNSTLLPAVSVTGLNRSSVADRDAHGQYTIAGMLEKINYPTSGYSKFDFESNTYTRRKTIEDVDFTPASTSNAIDSIWWDSEGDTIVLDGYFNDTSRIYTNFRLWGKLEPVQSQEETTGEIQLLKNGNIINTIQLSTTGILVNTIDVEMDVENNSYSIVAYLTNALPSNNGSPHVKGHLIYDIGLKQDMRGYIEQDAGGVRIHKITSYDPLSDTTLIKEYNYLQSGYLTSKETPNYMTSMTRHHIGPGYHPDDLIISITSSVHNGLGTVAYSHIRGFNGTADSNIGYKDEYFKKKTDNRVGGAPYLPVLNRGWVRSINNREVNMANNNGKFDTVQVTYSQYRIDTVKSSFIKGFKSARVMDVALEPGANSNDFYSGDQFRYSDYKFEDYKYLLKQKKVVNYFNSVKNIIITEYKYTNPFQFNPTEITTINSNGDTIKTVLKYPGDFLLDCYKPCLQTYISDISICETEFDSCFSDLNPCSAIFANCHTEWLDCLDSLSQYTDKHCYFLGIPNELCIYLARKKFHCNSSFTTCLQTSNYYQCLNSANCQASMCYDTAYTAYMDCKTDVYNCADDKYTNETNPFLKAVYFMFLTNIVNQPVETQKYVNNILTEDIKFNYHIFDDNDTLPLLKNIYSKYTSTSSFIKEADYEQYIDRKPVQVKLKNEPESVYIWDKTRNKLVAFVKNAARNEVFYQSFEDDDSGIFFNQNGINKAKTGLKVKQGNSYSIPADTVSNEDNLLMSYWYFDGSKWNYKEEPFSYQISVSGSCEYIDEIRVYPKDAFMTTYSYNGFGFLIGSTDYNGVTTHYQYDNLGRLITIRDNDYKVLKHFEYKYSSY